METSADSMRVLLLRLNGAEWDEGEKVPKLVKPKPPGLSLAWRPLLGSKRIKGGLSANCTRAMKRNKSTYDCSLKSSLAQMAEEGPGAEKLTALSVQLYPERSQDRLDRMKNCNYLYAGPGAPPQLLLNLESYVNEELQHINPAEPRYQELRLKVYQHVFDCLIREFATYRSLLAAIKREYETTLAQQKERIRKLEPLRSRLRLLTEDCGRKIQIRWEDEQAEIKMLQKEKQQLQKDIVAMKERGKDTQAVVDNLQSELSKQYALYREERDARELLLLELSEGLPTGPVRAEETTSEKKGPTDADVKALQLALQLSREELTKTQKELTRLKTEYWDVVPQKDMDALKQTHAETLQQLETVRGEFEEMKTEYNALLEKIRLEAQAKIEEAEEAEEVEVENES